MADSTHHLQSCLDRLQAGDEGARNELLSAACERLARLTRNMFRRDSRLQRWEDGSDIFQSAMVRLCRALQQVTPASLREFFGLAALQIRRELIDLARRYCGARLPSPPGGAAMDPEAPSSLDPGRLAVWGEFHEQIQALPDEEREAFDLVYYQGMTHAEAAALVQVSTKTIQRRWHRACLRLDEKMQGNLPGM